MVMDKRAQRAVYIGTPLWTAMRVECARSGIRSVSSVVRELMREWLRGRGVEVAVEANPGEANK